MIADVLTIEKLSVGYRDGRFVRPILREVSLSVPRGKTVALVGESGSGKSTIAGAVMGLLPKHRAQQSGRVLFRDGGQEIDLTRLAPGAFQKLRGNRVAMAFTWATWSRFSLSSSFRFNLNRLSARRLVEWESRGRDRVSDRCRRVLPVAVCPSWCSAVSVCGKVARL